MSKPKSWQLLTQKRHLVVWLSTQIEIPFHKKWEGEVTQMKEFSSGIRQKCQVQLQLLCLNMRQLGWVSLEIPELRGTKEQSKRQNYLSKNPSKSLSSKNRRKESCWKKCNPESFELVFYHKILKIFCVITVTEETALRNMKMHCMGQAETSKHLIVFVIFTISTFGNLIYQ